MELWVNYQSAASTQDFYAARVDYDAGVQIGLRDGTVSVWRTFANRVLVAAPTLPPAGVWHHVAYTFDRTTHILYLDGVMVASSTAASDDRTPNQAWLGTVDGSAELYKGLMDEVRVWTGARAATHIPKDLHRLPGPEPAGRLLDLRRRAERRPLAGSDRRRRRRDLGDGIAERMPSRVVSDAPVGP